MDVLRVEWSAITNATVASLVGSVDESATDALAGIRTLAKDLERVLVDLERVTHIDERGVVLLESLARIPNVGILNVPTRVEDEMRALGRFGF